MILPLLYNNFTCSYTISQLLFIHSLKLYLFVTTTKIVSSFFCKPVTYFGYKQPSSCSHIFFHIWALHLYSNFTNLSPVRSFVAIWLDSLARVWSNVIISSLMHYSFYMLSVSSLLLHVYNNRTVWSCIHGYYYFPVFNRLTPNVYLILLNLTNYMYLHILAMPCTKAYTFCTCAFWKQ